MMRAAVDKQAKVKSVTEDFDAGEASHDASQNQVVDCGWRYFAGSLTEEEALAHLVGRPPGTFLVRGRPDDAGQLMVAFVGRRTTAAGTFTQDVRTTHGSATHGTSSINEVRVYWTGSNFRVLDFGACSAASATSPIQHATHSPSDARLCDV